MALAATFHRAIGVTEPADTKARDALLVRRFRAGDRAAFEELVEHYQRPLYRLAHRYLGSRADAQDIVQKVFVRAFTSLSALRQRGSLRAWLYRIAVNQCLNHLRDHHREEVSEAPAKTLATPPTAERDLARRGEAELLRAAVADLPTMQRTVVELRIYDELPFREIAEIAECSVNSAKVNFHHALRKLSAVLAPLRTDSEINRGPR